MGEIGELVPIKRIRNVTLDSSREAEFRFEEGNFNSFLENVGDYYKQLRIELDSLEQIHAAYYHISASERQKNSTASVSEDVKSSAPLEGIQDLPRSVALVGENSPVIGRTERAATYLATGLRKQIIQELQQRREITGEPPESFLRLLNALVSDKRSNILEIILEFIKSGNIYQILKNASQLEEIFSDINSLKYKIYNLQYLKGYNLLYFVDGNKIDFEGLEELGLGKPENVSPKLLKLVKTLLEQQAEVDFDSLEKNRGQEVTRSVIITPQPKEVFKPQDIARLYNQAQNDNFSSREVRYKLEQAIEANVKEPSGYAVVCPDLVNLEGKNIYKPMAIVSVLGQNGRENYLVDPQTGERISESFVSIPPTPYRGLVRVSGHEVGDLRFTEDGLFTKHGLVDTQTGVIVVPLTATEYIPKYVSSRAEIISTGYSVVNITTKETLAEIPSGASGDVQVFGNLAYFSVLKEKEKGKKPVYEIKLLLSNGTEINSSGLEDIKELFVESEKTGYATNFGKSEYAYFCTFAKIKINGKWGVIDTSTGNIVLPCEQKNLKIFYGGKIEKKGNSVETNYVIAENDESQFRLFDSEIHDVFGRTFNSEQELEQSYDVKFPNSNRNKVHFSF